MASRPTITILAQTDPDNKWVKSRIDFTIETISDVLPKQCYAFLDKRDYPPADGRREALLAHFYVPEFVANRTCFELNGYFGSRAAYDEAKKHVIGCATWFQWLVKMVRKHGTEPHEKGPEYVDGDPNNNRADSGPDKEQPSDESGAAGAGKKKKPAYRWFEMSIFTRWEFPDTCQVLCIDAPFDLPDELEKVWNRPTAQPADFRDPFALHANLVDRIIVYCDIAVWRLRDPVRELEKKRVEMRTGGIFDSVHDIARHAIHTSEVLQAAIETVTALQKCQSDIHKKLPENQDLDLTYKEQARDYARFQISLVKALKLRSDSSIDRLKNEVNLAFNNLSRQDNSVMKSIALLTMIFLPATFFSALFSTTFFSYSDDGWDVSSKLWIYFATIVPATIVIVVVWQFWLANSDSIEKFRDNKKQWAIDAWNRKPAEEASVQEKQHP